MKTGSSYLEGVPMICCSWWRFRSAPVLLWLQAAACLRRMKHPLLQAKIPHNFISWASETFWFSITHAHTETHRYILFAAASLPVFSLCQLASCCGGAYENARHPLTQAGVKKIKMQTHLSMPLLEKESDQSHLSDSYYSSGFSLNIRRRVDWCPMKKSTPHKTLSYCIPIL